MVARKLLPGPKPAIRTVRSTGLRKRALLAAFQETGNLTEAARHARIQRMQHYRWMKEDADYPGAFEEARTIAVQTLEDEAVHRARHGVREPVYYQGRVVGWIFRKSDALLMFLLRGWSPHRYREQAGLSGFDGDVMLVETIEQRLISARIRMCDSDSLKTD